MGKKRKLAYTDIVDNKHSFNVYGNFINDDNSSNIKLRCEILMSIIERELTPKQRKILSLYYNYNLNIPEISEKLGKNKSTISRSLKLSRETIKNCMQYNNFRQ